MDAQSGIIYEQMFQPEVLENIATNLPVVNPLGLKTDLES